MAHGTIHDAHAPPYPAEKARGGEIILRTWPERLIFIAGLAGMVFLLYLLAVLAT